VDGAVPDEGAGPDAASCAGTTDQWALPGAGKRFDFTFNASCGLRYHTTLDMDGDLRPDLVETYDCIGGSDEGSKFWRVYRNTGFGFAAVPTQWALPGGSKRFDFIFNSSCGQRYHNTLDMD